MKVLVLILGLSASLSYASCPLKDGDIIFIKSLTNQAKLLRIVTESEWTHVGILFKNKSRHEVIEAVQPVRWTSLRSFIERSDKLSFEVHRPQFEFSSNEIKSYTEKLLGIYYDLIFSWDSNRWYCSELVWKAFKTVANKELGKLDKVGSLKVDDIRIRDEAQRRFESYGLPFDFEGWKTGSIITPVQMMKSPDLIKVFDEKDAPELLNCF